MEVHLLDLEDIFGTSSIQRFAGNYIYHVKSEGESIL